MITDINKLTDTISRLVIDFYKTHPERRPSTKATNYNNYVVEYILNDKYGLLRYKRRELLNINLHVKGIIHHLIDPVTKRINPSLMQDIKYLEEQLNLIKDNNIQPREQNILFGYILYTTTTFLNNNEILLLKNLGIDRFKSVLYIPYFIIYFSINTYCGTFERLKQIERYMKDDITQQEISYMYSRINKKLNNKQYSDYLIHNALLNIFKHSKYKDYFLNLNYIKHE